MQFFWLTCGCQRETGLFLALFLICLHPATFEEVDIELIGSGYDESDYDDLNNNFLYGNEDGLNLDPSKSYPVIQNLKSLPKAKVEEAKNKAKNGPRRKDNTGSESFKNSGEISSDNLGKDWLGQGVAEDPFHLTDRTQQHDSKKGKKKDNEKQSKDKAKKAIQNDGVTDKNNLRHYVTVDMRGAACCPTQSCQSTCSTTSSSKAISDQLRQLRSDVQFSVNSLSMDLRKQLGQMQKQLLAGIAHNNYRPDLNTAAQSGSQPQVVFSPCPPGFTPFQTSCYVFELHQTDWVSANKMCRDLHAANLVSIESQAEQNFLKNHIKRNKLKPEIPYKHWGFWTSGTDLDKEGVWIWHGTKRPVTFSAWGGNQPDNNYCRLPEGCMHMVGSYDFKWNDLPCFINLNSFICERPQRGVINLMEETLTKYRK
ncbi:uncharacterized protein LOC112042508 [Lingula anatina]|uniref:Uncharacterized protein LOC112042508 n=1 Tax=Lingula anatina TaxID=7574 RepID=A0A2R2MRM5_LINAN|nr:uncharacterized protein LOC112042508 [Lingula anatina]|eukprot:XP_023932905.1 uncharacterized protein LOC112042508 [Lingula anatina]